MPTDHHPALEQLLGTVGGAMTTPVLSWTSARRLMWPPASWLWGGRGGGAAPRTGGRRGDAGGRTRPVPPGRPVPQLPGPFLRHGRLLASLRVWQLMRAGPLGVAANQPLVEAARVMDDEHRDVLVVVDGHGQPVGIITASDPIRALASGSPARTLPQPAAGGSCRCSWPPVS